METMDRVFFPALVKHMPDGFRVKWIEHAKASADSYLSYWEQRTSPKIEIYSR